MTKAKATVRRDIAGRERSSQLCERAQKVYMVSGEFGDRTADLIYYDLSQPKFFLLLIKMSIVPTFHNLWLSRENKLLRALNFNFRGLFTM